MSACTVLCAPLRRIALVIGIMAAALLAGCATGPTANPNDPLEPWNRGVYKFNDAVDRALLKPAATAYTTITPGFARKGVRNFFSNLGDAWSFLNSTLQARGQDAMNSFWRFTINSTFGLGGLLDVASEARIPQNKQDFGMTLGRWGVGPGPYLVLPLIGPSTVRDTVALPLDMKANPVGAVHDVGVRNSLVGLGVVSQRADLIGTTDLLEQAALDPYSFTRDAYLQNRAFRIHGDDGGTAKGAASGEAAGSDDGYVPPPPEDDAAAAPPGAPASAAVPVATPPVGQAPADSSRPEQVARPQPPASATASAHGAATPYYTPAVPQLLDRVNPGWGGSLWRH